MFEANWSGKSIFSTTFVSSRIDALVTFVTDSTSRAK